MGVVSGVAVDGGGRAEHDPRDADRPCGLEQRDAAGDVVAVVARRLADRLADQRARRAMEDRLDPLALQEPWPSRPVRRSCRPRAARPSSTAAAMAGRQVVEDHDVVAGGEQGLAETEPT